MNLYSRSLHNQKTKVSLLIVSLLRFHYRIRVISVHWFCLLVGSRNNNILYIYNYVYIYIYITMFSNIYIYNIYIIIYILLYSNIYIIIYILYIYILLNIVNAVVQLLVLFISVGTGRYKCYSVYSIHTIFN